MNHDTIMKIVHNTELFTFIQDDQKDVLLLIVKSCWGNVSVTNLTGLGPTIVGEEGPIYPNYSKGPIWSKDSIHTRPK